MKAPQAARAWLFAAAGQAHANRAEAVRPMAEKMAAKEPRYGDRQGWRERQWDSVATPASIAVLATGAADFGLAAHPDTQTTLSAPFSTIVLFGCGDHVRSTDSEV